MAVVQGHIHDHLTIMPPVLQIIPSISVVIWLQHVQSWIFNSAIVGLAPPPPILYAAIARSLASTALCLFCLSVSAVNSSSKQRLNRSLIQPARLQTPRSFALCNSLFKKSKQMFYARGKGELIDPSPLKFPQMLA